MERVIPLYSQEEGVVQQAMEMVEMGSEFSSWEYLQMLAVDFGL